MDSWENLNYDPENNGEEFVLKVLSRFNFQCIFDVGASTGKWTLMAARYFPGAKIHCFEIAPETLMELKKSIQRNQQIVINEFGLLDQNQTINIKYYPDEKGKSSIYDYPHQFKSESVQGKVMRGDSYIQDYRIDLVNFLKIDTEGSEYLVLKGFAQSLQEKKIEIIQFEYGKLNIIAGFLLYNFYELLSSYDYVVGKIYPNYVDFRDYDFKHEDFRGPNFLAVHKDREDIIKALN